MAIYYKVEQRSEEWHLQRLGVPSSSDFHRIVTPGGKANTPKLSAQAPVYMYTLLAELMLGHVMETPDTYWMQRGTELEDGAIQAYEFQTDTETEPGGWVTDDLGRYGCSPDRLVGEDGVLEMKCPAPNTHVGYLLTRDIDADKKPQVQGQLLVTGRHWVDLVSFHPELPSLVARVTRDETYISYLKDALECFCDTMAEMRVKLEREYGPFPQIMLPKDRPAPPDVLDVSDEDLDRILSTRWQL